MKLSPKSLLGINPDLKVDTRNLPDGEQGNLLTVSYMSKIARQKSKDKRVRQVVIQILNDAGTESHNHLDEAVAIGEWVKRNVRYMKDPHEEELLTDPLLMLEAIETGEARGDCDDMSLLTATLLICAGIKPYFKIIRHKEKKGNFNHIYVVVCEGNYKQPRRAFALDCIIKDRPMGYEMEHASSELIPV